MTRYASAADRMNLASALERTGPGYSPDAGRDSPCPAPGSRRSSKNLVFLAVAGTLLVSSGAALGQPEDVQTESPPLQVVEAYLSENAMQILYGRNMDVGEFGRNDARVGVFINEERDLIGIADMLFRVGEQRRRPYWSLEVGPRAYGALLAVENQDIFSIGLGGRLSYRLGRARASAVSLTAFYAPDIVTFGNADNIKDVSVRLETRLSDTTDLFIGYRMFEIDLEVDREVDDNMHLGVRHRF